MFFRSMVHLFGAILNDVTISSFIILPRASLFVGRVGRFKLYHSASCFAVCRTCLMCFIVDFRSLCSALVNNITYNNFTSDLK